MFFICYLVTIYYKQGPIFALSFKRLGDKEKFVLSTLLSLSCSPWIEKTSICVLWDDQRDAEVHPS